MLSVVTMLKRFDSNRYRFVDCGVRRPDVKKWIHKKES